MKKLNINGNVTIDIQVNFLKGDLVDEGNCEEQ